MNTIPAQEIAPTLPIESITSLPVEQNTTRPEQMPSAGLEATQPIESLVSAEPAVVDPLKKDFISLADVAKQGDDSLTSLADLRGNTLPEQGVSADADPITTTADTTEKRFRDLVKEQSNGAH